MRQSLRRPILAGFLAGALTLSGSAAAQAAPRPEVIPLPNGFEPEGVAAGPGSTVFAGSLDDGDVVRVDLRSGDVDVLVDNDSGTAVGMKVNQRTGQLVVAGGPSGLAHVYDIRTGDEVGSVELTPPGSFVNDVTLTGDGAWFTDSFLPQLYFLPIGPSGALGTPQTLRLSGPAADATGFFNLNGIAASPDGSRLIVAHSGRAEVILVDPDSGSSETIDLAGASLPNADGILLDGPRLWVVQNQLNQIAEIRLDAGYESGSVVSTRTSDAFDVPTTVARSGNSLAAVNARFGTPATPDTTYDLVVIPR